MMTTRELWNVKKKCQVVWIQLESRHGILATPMMLPYSKYFLKITNGKITHGMTKKKNQIETNQVQSYN